MADKLVYDIYLAVVPSNDLDDELAKVEFSDTSTGKTVTVHDRGKVTLAAGATKSIFPGSYTGSTLNYFIRPVYPTVSLAAQKFQVNADAVGLTTHDFAASGMVATSLTIKNTGAVDYTYEYILFERTD